MIEGVEMQKNIVETARDAGTFTTLIAAIDRAGLEPTLAGEGRSPSSLPATRRSRNCLRERSSRCSPSPTS
jgi:hypothetical protein